MRKRVLSVKSRQGDSTLRVLKCANPMSHMNPKRPKVEPIRQPTLFQMEKLDEVADLTSQLKIERPFSLPGIRFGTSAFTAAGWEGSFYPRGMQPRKAVLAIMELTELV